MARRLTKTVVVRDPKTFGPKVFHPGDDVPAWAADLITNPTAWSSEEDTEDTPEGDESPPVPPTSGKGSGRDAWAAYANAKGVEVEEDMSRDDIVAACELAGIPIA